MIKTIAIAAFGTFIAAAAPAIAGPGIVLNGINLNGIAATGVSRAVVASVALPTATPVAIVPIVAEEPTVPMQSACLSGCGRIKYNGINLNGLQWNGAKLNGWELNGLQLNGWELNSKNFNGTATGAVGSGHAGASFAVTAVTLPGGERVTITN